MPDPISPDLAVALAAAAGLDPTDLKEQIRRQNAGDDDPAKLHERIAALEAQVAQVAGQSATPTPGDAESQDAAVVPVRRPHEVLAESLHAAQSKWLTLGGPGGSDGEAA